MEENKDTISGILPTITQENLERLNASTFYHLIPPALLGRVAAAMKKGSQQYGGHPLYRDWLRRIHDPQFAVERYNHMFEHMLSWFVGDRGEDHLAHIVSNVILLMDVEAAREEAMRRSENVAAATEEASGSSVPPGGSPSPVAVEEKGETVKGIPTEKVDKLLSLVENMKSLFGGRANGSVGAN